MVFKTSALLLLVLLTYCVFQTQALNIRSARSAPPANTAVQVLKNISDSGPTNFSTQTQGCKSMDKVDMDVISEANRDLYEALKIKPAAQKKVNCSISRTTCRILASANNITTAISYTPCRPSEDYLDQCPKEVARLEQLKQNLTRTVRNCSSDREGALRQAVQKISDKTLKDLQTQLNQLVARCSCKECFFDLFAIASEIKKEKQKVENANEAVEEAISNYEWRTNACARTANNKCINEAKGRLVDIAKCVIYVQMDVLGLFSN